MYLKNYIVVINKKNDYCRIIILKINSMYKMSTLIKITIILSLIYAVSPEITTNICEKITQNIINRMPYNNATRDILENCISIR